MSSVYDMQYYRVRPGLPTEVDDKPGAGAGQEAEKALNISPRISGEL